MSDKYKDLEGSVPVNGDITPISRKPIDQIDSSEWANMTTAELIEQRNALQSRINLALSMGQAQLIPTMQRGLLFVDALLQQRQSKEETHLI